MPLKETKIGGNTRYFRGIVRFAPLAPLAVIQIDAYDREASVYSLEAMKIIGRLDGHEKRISVIEFTPDEKYIITGSNDGSIRIWSPANGDRVTTLAGHTNTVTGISVANAHTIVTASLDRTVRVWDLRSFVQTAIFVFSSDVMSLSPVSSTGWFAIGLESGGGLLDVITGRRIWFAGARKLTFPNVTTGAGGRLLLTTDIHDFGNKQIGAIHEVRDLTLLVGTTKEGLLQQACSHGLGNEGARAFSPEERQSGALRGRPDLRNPCSGVQTHDRNSE
jgi:WD40 repeat protein